MQLLLGAGLGLSASAIACQEQTSSGPHRMTVIETIYDGRTTLSALEAEFRLMIARLDAEPYYKNISYDTPARWDAPC